MPVDPKIQALAAALNAGKAQPSSDGMPVSPFVMQQNQLLEQERANEQQLVQQRMQEEDAQRAMLNQQAEQAPPLSRQPNPGETTSAFLTRLSIGSPRGQAQWQKKEADDMALAKEIQRIKETPMPAEFGSPGWKGKAFNAFQYMIGRPVL